MDIANGHTDDVEPDPDAVVEEHWPYDGPHDDNTITTALAAAARLIRYANNASQRGTRYAASVDRALGSVHALLYGLDQLTDQLAATLTQHAEDPGIYDDRDYLQESGARVAIDAAAQTRRIGPAAVEVARTIEHIRAITSHIGQR